MTMYCILPNETVLFKSTTQKGAQWIRFAEEVLKHIEGYAVPQYGDYPKDEVCGYTGEDFAANFKRYVARLNSNARGETESKRDLLKIAHYAALLHFKRYMTSYLPSELYMDENDPNENVTLVKLPEI